MLVYAYAWAYIYVKSICIRIYTCFYYLQRTPVCSSMSVSLHRVQDTLSDSQRSFVSLGCLINGFLQLPAYKSIINNSDSLRQRATVINLSAKVFRISAFKCYGQGWHTVTAAACTRHTYGLLIDFWSTWQQLGIVIVLLFFFLPKCVTYKLSFNVEGIQAVCQLPHKQKKKKKNTQRLSFFLF